MKEHTTDKGLSNAISAIRLSHLSEIKRIMREDTRKINLMSAEFVQRVISDAICLQLTIMRSMGYPCFKVRRQRKLKKALINLTKILILSLLSSTYL